jgi:hypothetical protein
MFNMMSVVNLFFLSGYKIAGYFAKLKGNTIFAEKMEKRAKRCNQKILFYEGSGPWPEKETS